MPCDRDYTMSVDFDPKNIGHLQTTLTRLGWKITSKITSKNDQTINIYTDYGPIVIQNKQATGNQYAVNLLRVEYAKTLVAYTKEQAKMKGWVAQQSSPNKLTIRRI